MKSAVLKHKGHPLSQPIVRNIFEDYILQATLADPQLTPTLPPEQRQTAKIKADFDAEMLRNHGVRVL